MAPFQAGLAGCNPESFRSDEGDVDAVGIPASVLKTESILRHPGQLVTVKVMGDIMGQIRIHLHLAEAYPRLGNIIELYPALGFPPATDSANGEVEMGVPLLFSRGQRHGFHPYLRVALIQVGASQDFREPGHTVGSHNRVPAGG